MEIQVVSFKTAKLAKEKGFNIPVIHYYSKVHKNSKKSYLTSSEGYQTEQLVKSDWNDGLGNYPTLSDEVECSAPTQCLLLKWLRKKHNIIVKIRYDISGWFYIIKYILYSYNNQKIFPDFTYEVGYNTYKEALEKGLLEGLKLIK